MRAGTSTAWPLVGRGAELERAAAVLDDSGPRLLLLIGPSGCGKSRLAAEVLARAERDGFPVAHVVATRAAAAVPLSALSGLLPAGATTGATSALLEGATEHVRDIADGSRVVLVVDDVDLLDSVSLSVLGRLLADGHLTLVATQRVDATTPEVVFDELRRGTAEVLEIADLSRRSVATLLHRALQGPVADRAELALWQASQGNPLLLRELVEEGLRSDRLVRVDDVWMIAEDLGVPAGVASVVAARLARLRPEAREVVERLAVCEPLGLRDLLGALTPLELERLEVEGYISTELDGRREVVRVAHPLHAQVARDGLVPLARRRLLLEEVARLRARGARRRGDALRIAVWQLDATGEADPGVLATACEQARSAGDAALLARLARVWRSAAAEDEAALLEASALLRLGRAAEADAVLTAVPASRDAGSGPDWTALHGVVLAVGLGRTSDALRLLDADPPGEGGRLLRAVDALVRAANGDLREAEVRLAALEALAGADPVPREVDTALSLARAWVSRGRPAAGGAAGRLASEDAGPEVGADSGSMLVHPSEPLLVQALTLLEGGRAQDARRYAVAGRDLAVEHGAHLPAAWCAWAVAWIDLNTGFVDDAATAFTELLAVARRTEIGDVERQAAFGLAETCALQGRRAEALRWRDRARATGWQSPTFRAQTAMAEAWVAAVDGRVDAAATLLRSATEEALERGDLRDAAMLADEVLLVGDTASAPWAEEVVSRVDTPVNDARRARARALHQQDPQAMLAAAELFEQCGYVHSAAVLCTQAAHALSVRGAQRASAAAEVRARALVALSPGLVVPGLEQEQSALQLTPREREIAELAATGRSSRDIARLLVLSVRTVDNHLARAYTKLGISSRGELPEMLGRMPSTTGGSS